jgi:hypothetical protein
VIACAKKDDLSCTVPVAVKRHCGRPPREPAHLCPNDLHLHLHRLSRHESSRRGGAPGGGTHSDRLRRASRFLAQPPSHNRNSVWISIEASPSLRHAVAGSFEVSSVCLPEPDRNPKGTVWWPTRRPVLVACWCVTRCTHPATEAANCTPSAPSAPSLLRGTRASGDRRYKLHSKCSKSSSHPILYAASLTYADTRHWRFAASLYESLLSLPPSLPPQSASASRISSFCSSP